MHLHFGAIVDLPGIFCGLLQGLYGKQQDLRCTWRNRYLDKEPRLGELIKRSGFLSVETLIGLKEVRGDGKEFDRRRHKAIEVAIDQEGEL